MAPEDMIIVDLEGRKLSGRRKRSSEIGMHVLIYRMRPDVNAVCHAHPSTCDRISRRREFRWTGRFCANKWLRWLRARSAVRNSRARPNWRRRLSHSSTRMMQFCLRTTGSCTYGPDLLTAFFRMELTEHLARVSLVTKLLGKEACFPKTTWKSCSRRGPATEFNRRRQQCRPAR